jgi:hypothetical protein
MIHLPARSYFYGKSLLSNHPVIRFSSYEGDPRSLPQGEAPKGEIPDPPIFPEGVNFLKGISLHGDAQAAGVEASRAFSPKEPQEFYA